MNVRDLPPSFPPASLVTDPTAIRMATNQRSTDATTALTRGVAQYAAGLSINATGGRFLKFEKCMDAWATPEELAEYPSFIAYTNGTEGAYDASNFSPRVSDVRYPDGTYEVSSAEMSLDLICEVWATDPEARQSMVLMLEEAFAPVDWRYGFVLDLPHYFNQRATFAPVRTTYFGGAQEGLQQFVNARMILKASVPVTRVLGFPEAKPDVRVSVGSDVLASGSQA